MAKKVVVEMEVRSGDAKAQIDNVKDSVKDVKKETKDLSVQTEELGGTLDTVTGGAITKFKGFKNSLKGVIGSFKTLRGAIIATGIGALIIAVTSLTQAFTASEEGQNRFAKILKQLGVIAGNIGDIFYSLGDTIYNVFTGNFDAAGKAFDQFKERIANFGDETRREIAVAGELADKIADANKKERELLVERAQTNVEINKLKTKAAEVDKFTAEQRIFFLEKAAALEDEITKKEVGLAELRRDIKIEENSLSESTREDLEEEAQLVANVIQLEEQRLIKNKELLGVAAGLRKTQADLRAAERKSEIDEFAKQQETITGILKNSIVEREALQITTATNTNDELRAIQLEKARVEVATEEVTAEQKLQIAANTLGDIASIIGENTAVGKAAGIAQATINALLGATQVLGAPSVLPEPAGSIQKGISAAAILAAGFRTVKQIASTKVPKVGGSSPRGGGGGGAPAAPSFNVVGAAPENQLAEAIGQNEKQPIKAFVVSNEVSSQQELDRNITQEASIG